MTSIASKHLAPVLDRLRESGASYDLARLQRAYTLASTFYGDQFHWTGETLLGHVLGVLEELSPFEPDEDTVIACLLHQVLELKAMTLTELEEQFGAKVRSLVSGVHLLSHVTLEGRRRSIEDLRIMLLSVSDDVRVLFMALCDRAHCLKFVDRIEAARAKRLSQDVVQLFAPVAARLGMYSLKHKLEHGAFPVLYPSDADRITEQLTKVNSEYPDLMQNAKTELEGFLQEQGISAHVTARQKQPYSIFQKMHRKSITHIEDIHDLIALRVVVHSEEDCYRALGLLHRLARPLPNRFKDYIAFPKPNGYQSLHTTLAGFKGFPENTYTEVQIRTQQMDREARFGIAAHWSYKESGATMRAMEKVQLHSALLGQESIDDDTEGQSLADHIFVLTPRGDIIELPEGATPLDFAFQVHTDLGLSFRGARVNGSMVSLDYALENGDVVEIQKHSSPQPSTSWMQMLRMASSRSKLRRYLYAQERPKLVAQGRDLVNEELKKRSLPKLTTDLSILRQCDGDSLTFAQREDILMKIGQGAEKASTLLMRLNTLEHSDVALEASPRKEAPAQHTQGSAMHIGIEGGIAMPKRFAKCCNPHEGVRESIVGNINREGVVMIHKNKCRMFHNTNPERRVRVWWE